MPIVVMILVIVALICFLMGTINMQPPAPRPINFESLGLAVLTIAYLVGRAA